MAFIIIIVLVILNGYFSLAEIALITVKREELKADERQKDRKAARVLQLIKVPEEFLSVIQVGTTLLGLLEGIFGGGMVAGQLEHWFLLSGIHHLAAHIAGMVIGIGAVTYLTLVFGELVPKAIALQMPLRASLAIAPSLVIFSKILYPFIKMLTASTRFILSLFSIKKGGHKNITEKDLKLMLGAAYQEGLLNKKTLWMHENLFTLDNLKAKNIMKPARISVSLSDKWKRDEVMKTIGKSPYSNFPVYRHDPGHIIGVLHLKSFLLSESEDWHESVKKGFSVPGETPVRDLFENFKKEKIDFAIVTDSHENFSGLVAMQDIMEGVFGDMPELEDYRDYFYAKSKREWIAESFIHLQRVGNTLNLPWLRAYGDKYLSLAEFFAGESALVSSDGKIKLHGVTFKVIAGAVNDPRTIRISLPSRNLKNNNYPVTGADKN